MANDKHCKNCGGFETNEGQCNNCNHIKLEDELSVDNFFFYDDEKRGLLAKRNSSHGKWNASLTPFQRATLNDYTADGYSNINSLLLMHIRKNRFIT